MQSVVRSSTSFPIRRGRNRCESGWRTSWKGASPAFSRASDRTSEVGKKRLKGLEEPVLLFEVRWQGERVMESGWQTRGGGRAIEDSPRQRMQTESPIAWIIASKKAILCESYLTRDPIDEETARGLSRPNRGSASPEARRVSAREAEDRGLRTTSRGLLRSVPLRRELTDYQQRTCGHANRIPHETGILRSRLGSNCSGSGYSNCTVASIASRSGATSWKTASGSSSCPQPSGPPAITIGSPLTSRTTNRALSPGTRTNFVSPMSNNPVPSASPFTSICVAGRPPMVTSFASATSTPSLLSSQVIRSLGRGSPLNREAGDRNDR